MQLWHGPDLCAVTCGSFSSSVQDSPTTPGRMKHARLSTWPFVMASSPAMPLHSQMILVRPRYSFSTCHHAQP